MKTALHPLALAFLLAPAFTSQAQVVLSLDFEERGLPITNTFPGFSSFISTTNNNVATAPLTNTPTVRTYGAITVTLAGLGNPVYDDRVRALPTNNPSGLPGFTQEQLLRNFVFQGSITHGDGLSVTIDGLTAGATYKVTIWSYDNSSTTARVSDWFANGVLVKTAYSFAGGAAGLPTTDARYQFNFTIAADVSGRMLVQGRRTSGPTTGGSVFINAMSLEVVPPDPPVISQQPASLSLFTQARASFNVQATGTSPFAYQWRKDGDDLVDETNQTLTVNNLMLSDAGGYDVVVTNVAGSVTSLVAMLTVTLRPPPPAVFMVDFNDLGTNDVATNTESGFSSFSIPEYGAGPFTHSYGGADVTLTAIGTTMESRKRATPTNSGSFTEERLFQDFIFTRDATVAQGLDVAVEFLETNTPYRLGIWSFDTLSTTPYRVSDWTANGVSVTNGYSFSGTNAPANNNTYRFNFDAFSDANGKILIQGRRSSSATAGLNVFINALKVEKLELRIIGIEYPTAFDITLVVQIVNPAASHFLVKKTSLSDPLWQDEVNAAYEGPTAGILKVTFERPVGPEQFYRILQVNP